jgi:hypothetical protein
MEKKEKQINENKVSNQINEEKPKTNTMLEEYKSMVKLLQKQKKLGLINRSEYNYLKTFYLLNLTDN